MRLEFSVFIVGVIAVYGLIFEGQPGISILSYNAMQEALKNPDFTII
jgi:hypothetical protein